MNECFFATKHFFAIFLHLIELGSPQVAQLGIFYLYYCISSRDLFKDKLPRESDRGRKRRFKSQIPCGFQTNNLLITSRVLDSCATANAHRRHKHPFWLSFDLSLNHFAR